MQAKSSGLAKGYVLSHGIGLRGWLLRLAAIWTSLSVLKDQSHSRSFMHLNKHEAIPK